MSLISPDSSQQERGLSLAAAQARGTTRLPILLYHNLEYPGRRNENNLPATRDTVIAVEHFEEHLGFLASQGYRTISLSDYFKCRTISTTETRRDLILTFDDGHRSNFELAFPALLRHGFKATFFVVTGRVGSPNHMTCGQIRTMAAAGMEIGSHGVSHRFLPLLAPNEIRWELEESKRSLEAVLGTSVDFFAFPGGHYSRRVLRLLVASGYLGACSCRIGFNSGRTDPRRLRRVEIRRRIRVQDFAFLAKPRLLYPDRVVEGVKQILRLGLGLRGYTRVRSHMSAFYPFKR